MNYSVKLKVDKETFYVYCPPFYRYCTKTIAWQNQMA